MIKTFKRIGLTLLHLVRQACFLPQIIASAARRKRLQVAREARESERLDRIRHPWKYLGK